MRSLFRIFSLSLICLLLIAPNDAAINIYGHRVGRSLAAAQGTSVVTVNPSAYQTPVPPPWWVPVDSPSNTGFGNSTVSVSGDSFDRKNCRWYAFQAVSGPVLSITLKFDWSESGSIFGPPWQLGSNNFWVAYSLDGWSTLTTAFDHIDVTSLNSGTFQISLPPSQDISQIQVYAELTVDGYGLGSGATLTASVSNIRLEVETVNCPASVAADRWRGEYYNNTNLSGIPPTVRDDGAGFLSFNFGGDPPAGTCGLPADNFSARWTRMINFPLPRGVYRFTVTADDGVRLYVDGQLKIDAWVLQPPTTYTADVILTAGAHEIKLEYFEYTGGALISLNWTTLVNCVMASVPTDRWRGDYYNGTTLSGDLAMVRDDSNGTDFLNLNFGSGSPSSVCGVSADNFSARWTRTVNFAAGTYRFFAAVDNGVRLYVDGQSKIDQWGNLPPNTYTADVALTAGNHEIKLEFVEYEGGASVSLFWADVNCLANVPANRWKGEYFNNVSLTDFPAMVRDDGAGFLNFDFGLGSPSTACGIGVDNFSVRWTRTVNFGSGVYRFSVTGDDGVRLYVDGQLKIDKWFPQGATTYTADVQLSAGNHEVKLEYFESGGPGVALLSWTLVTGLSCLPDVPIIGSAPQIGGGESIATATISQPAKPCGQKKSD
jgi:PA14 domain